MPRRDGYLKKRTSLGIYFSLLVILLFTPNISAQEKNRHAIDSSMKDQKDITDILGLNGKSLKADSLALTKRGPFISVIPVVGYSRNTGITGVLSTSTTFYADELRNKLSRIQFNANYSQFHQYWFTLLNNLFFDNHRLHLFGDMRYYKFPTHTFGLGPFSKNASAIKIDYSYLRLYQVIYGELGSNFYAGMGYELDAHWNIDVDTIPGKEMQSFLDFQKGHSSKSSGFSINLLYDSRLNSVNPQGGTYINLQFRDNLRFIGSDQDWQVLLIEMRHYIRLPANSHNMLALWSYNNIVLSGIAPYLDLPSIGWDSYSNTGRGYVPGRYTGRILLYFESEYRFRLTGNGLLGGVVFGNLGSIAAKLPNEIAPLIPGGGLGLRIKMNKHSNTNLAIDYGFGQRRSRGFYFNLGEFF